MKRKDPRLTTWRSMVVNWGAFVLLLCALLLSSCSVLFGGLDNKLDPSAAGYIGGISTVAGNGSAGTLGDGGPATSAELNGPLAVAVDSSGNLYILENGPLREVAPGGTISSLASVSGLAMAIGPNGDLYVAGGGSNQVYQVTPTGTVTVIAGTGTAGYTGDNQAATSAELDDPAGIAVDGSGNIYIADAFNNVVREIYTSGTIATIAGTGAAGFSGDGGPAQAAKLNLQDTPHPNYNEGQQVGIAVDGAGNIYVADPGNCRIRKISASEIISTYAGNGSCGFSGDGGAATSAAINAVDGLSLDSAGDLFLADPFNNRVREVNAKGIMSTVVGNGTAGFAGDGGSPLKAELNDPIGLAVDSSGTLYLTDWNNNRVRKAVFQILK